LLPGLYSPSFLLHPSLRILLIYFLDRTWASRWHSGTPFSKRRTDWNRIVAATPSVACICGDWISSWM
jgi:hypothetical protein